MSTEPKLEQRWTACVARLSKLGRNATLTAVLEDGPREGIDYESLGREGESAAAQPAKCPNCGAGNDDVASEICNTGETAPGCGPYCPMEPWTDSWPTQAEFDAKYSEAAPSAAETAMTAEQFASTELFRIEKDNLFCWKVYLCDSLIGTERTELRARNRVQRLSHLIDKKLAMHVREAAQGDYDRNLRDRDRAIERWRTLAETAERKLAELEKALHHPTCKSQAWQSEDCVCDVVNREGYARMRRMYVELMEERDSRQNH